MNVVLGYLVQSKDLDLTAPSYQPAEVIDASMIDVQVECVRKTTGYLPGHLGCNSVPHHRGPFQHILS